MIPLFSIHSLRWMTEVALDLCAMCRKLQICSWQLKFILKKSNSIVW